MLPSYRVRIIEPDNNRRGDLFARLMGDLFIALGYDQPRLNIHKSGRELDLSTVHRLEPRRAIAECKATGVPIGGADLNKFVGLLDVEGGKEKNRPLVSYFISLAGFTETAIEQENDRQNKIIILDGQGIIDELIKGRILISKDRATELAGRCCFEKDGLVLDDSIELLAHERGWIWLVYYTLAKARSHFVLIHSDGTLLDSVLVAEILNADRKCEGALNCLMCLNPERTVEKFNEHEIVETLSAYSQYITAECGYIQLDGLPADSDVGSRKLGLENLFVPLHLDIHGKGEVQKRIPVGKALSDLNRITLLAAPGGGKSTLVKRLAVAYVDSSRRKNVADNLPDRNWLPLFFRCRELRELARGSFADLLEALSQREPVRHHKKIFLDIVNKSLKSGKFFLLIDGLDEISDAGDIVDTTDVVVIKSVDSDIEKKSTSFLKPPTNLPPNRIDWEGRRVAVLNIIFGGQGVRVFN